MNDATLDLLRDLVALDSVNPSLVPGGAGEAAVAERLVAEMRSFGADAQTVEVLPGRPNAIGVLEGRAPGPTLLFCGHLDTVGVAGMAAPFSPEIRDGRLYGRGSQDMKGGVAAMVGAARRLAEAGGPAAGRLVIAGVMDEEFESAGAQALVEEWTADAAVVTEPTDLAIGVAHKGFTWVEVMVEGRAAHGSRPAEGRDAILRTGRLLARLEALDREVQSRPPHPHLGPGSLHASLIAGGRELSSYPDRCTLSWERRTVPGDPAGGALAETEAILAALREEDPELVATARLLLDRRPYETPAGHPLPEQLAEAARRTGRPAAIGGATFWADAAILGHAGIPTVLYGPGGAGLHGLVEYVRLDEVLACRDTLAELARAWCG
jgi:acetylornithine deacetylase